MLRDYSHQFNQYTQNTQSTGQNEQTPLVVAGNEQNNLPEERSKCQSALITVKNAAAGTVVPTLMGALGVFSFYYCGQQVMLGLPQYAQQVLVPLMQISTPVIGTVVATDVVLSGWGVNSFVIPRAALSAAIAGFGMDTFLNQFAFAVVTEVEEEIFNVEPPIIINNGPAITILAGCGAMALLQTIRTYFIEEAQRTGQPISEVAQNCLSRLLYALSTNPLSRVLLSSLDSASAWHSFLEVAEKAAGLEGDMADTIRLGGTFLGATAGFGSGLPQNPYANPISRPYENILKLVKLTAFTFGTVELFTGPNSEAFFGEETLKEEEYFWPSLMLYVIILQTLGFAGPKLWKLVSEFITNYCGWNAQDDNTFTNIQGDHPSVIDDLEQQLSPTDSTVHPQELQFPMDDLEEVEVTDPNDKKTEVIAQREAGYQASLLPAREIGMLAPARADSYDSKKTLVSQTHATPSACPSSF